MDGRLLAGCRLPLTPKADNPILLSEEFRSLTEGRL